MTGGGTNAACRRIALFMLLACVSPQLRLDAQTINIKLVNGRDGRPMANTCVDVGIGHTVHMLAIPTDKDGVASFRLTDDSVAVNTSNAWKACGDFGVASPIVKHSDSFGVHAPFALCQSGGANYSWLATMTFSTKEVLERGIVRANSCGKATAAPVPGEVIIFVRPLTFWEKLKQ